MNMFNLQVALFLDTILSRPDTFAENVNLSLGNIFSEMPIINNVPQDAPAQIPIVQRTGNRNSNFFNVARNRCDLFIKPNVTALPTVQACITENRNLLEKFIEGVFNEQKGIIRMGIILNAFEHSQNAVLKIDQKIFVPNFRTASELSFRVNLPDKVNDIRLNKVIEIAKGAIVQEGTGVEDNGVIMQYDINNIPIGSKLLRLEELKTLLEYCLKEFEDKSIEELT